MLAGMEGVLHEASDIATLRDEPPFDVRLAALAGRQHGVVSLHQLRSLGLGGSGVRDRVAAGRLHGVHRGVYAVGVPLLTPRARWMAATLAYGRAAALSHRSAAAHIGLRANHSGPIDISLPSAVGRSRPGIAVHRSTTLRAEDIATVDGIRCTTVARTLLDLADVLNRRGLERAIEQAEVLRIFNRRQVDLHLTRAAGRHGAPTLRAVLDANAEPAFTESELEEAFLDLCEGQGLPRPEVAVWVTTGDGPLKVDFLYRAQRVVVETDGYTFHGHRQAFERDHRRDALLDLAGWKVRRFTWRQIAMDADLVAATVRAALGEPH